MQIRADRRDPRGAARPMGYRVAGHNTAASQAPGILTSTMDAILWIKDRMALR